MIKYKKLIYCIIIFLFNNEWSSIMLNLLTNIPAAVWSAIAAIGSFATALFAYK